MRRAHLPVAVSQLLQEWHERQQRRAERRGGAAATVAGWAAIDRGSSDDEAEGTGGGAGGSAAEPDPAVLFDVLRRQPLQRLQQLLGDCGLPAYGSKDVLLHRITHALAHPNSDSKDPDSNSGGDALEGQPEPAGPAPGEAAGGGAAGGGASAGAAPALHPARAQVAAEAAARAALLAAVVDVREVCGWLAAARAEDICVIDVR